MTIAQSTAIIVGVIALSQWFLSIYLKGRIEESIRFQTEKKLEEVRYDYKIREQASKIAEYMILARDLKSASPREDYQKANQMAWELAMWLPDSLYREMTKVLTGDRNAERNELQLVIKVRKLLLKEGAGSLTGDDVLHHAPGIGIKR